MSCMHHSLCLPIAILASGRYCLHIDGKHKIHHGKWMLVTIGVHDLSFETTKNKVTHSFRPLVYQFVKQQESEESVRMLCNAVNFLAHARFGAFLDPGVVIMDHSCGFRRGVLDIWPNAGINTCWPHLKRKVGQGEYLSTTHPFFKSLCAMLDAIHLSQSEDMQDLLIKWAGVEMDRKMPRDKKLRTLWNEYLVVPWSCWGIGLNLDTPLNISNNQPIEAWHRTVMRVLKTCLKGSTAAVLEHSFPKVVHRDGARCRISSCITLVPCMYHNTYHLRIAHVSHCITYAPRACTAPCLTPWQTAVSTETHSCAGHTARERNTVGTHRAFLRVSSSPP